MSSTQETVVDINTDTDSEDRSDLQDNSKGTWESPAWWNKPKTNPGDEFIFWGY